MEIWAYNDAGIPCYINSITHHRAYNGGRPCVFITRESCLPAVGWDQSRCSNVICRCEFATDTCNNTAFALELALTPSPSNIIMGLVSTVVGSRDIFATASTYQVAGDPKKLVPFARRNLVLGPIARSSAPVLYKSRYKTLRRKRIPMASVWCMGIVVCIVNASRSSTGQTEPCSLSAQQLCGLCLLDG